MKSANQFREKIEVIIIAGFLGAGKTTLLKRILSWESHLKETVVIVNEFGDIGIDRSLLKDAGSEVVELAGGCICCALRTDLKLTLKRIHDEYDPKRILIEATGVADPGSIIEVLHDQEFQPHMKVQKVITVLEADFWEDRENFGSFFLNQLKEANLILLNKIDSIGADKIRSSLNEIHREIPDSHVLPTIHCNIDPESIWIEGLRQDFGLRPDHFFYTVPQYDISKEKPHHQDNGSNSCEAEIFEAEKMGYVAFSYLDSKPLDEDCFKRFTEELPWELFRMKGPVRFLDRTVMLNYVGGKSEWTDCTGVEETRLAFVGLKIKGEETIRKLKNCIARS